MRNLKLKMKLVAVGVAVLATCGCKAENSIAPARVSGKVTLKGVPVTAGTVTFLPTDPSKSAISAYIDAKGNYASNALPVGEMIVLVTPGQDPKQQAPGYTGGKGMPGAGKQAAGYSPIPEGVDTTGGGAYMKLPPKYGDRNRTPLKVVLERGNNEFNFDLNDD